VSAPKRIQLEHMTPWDRNQRLYEQLKSMGLFVTPVCFTDDPSKISWLQVSAQAPMQTLEELVDRMIPSSESSVPVNVSLPLEGTKIAEVVAPFLAHGDNVVDFPSIG